MKNTIKAMKDFFIASKLILKAQGEAAGIIGHRGSIGSAREKYLEPISKKTKQND